MIDEIDETDGTDDCIPDVGAEVEVEADDIASGALGSYVVAFGRFLGLGTYSIVDLDNAVIGLAIAFDICRLWSDVHGCRP